MLPSDTKLRDVHWALFAKYHLMCKVPYDKNDKKETSLANVDWMCQTALNNCLVWPIDKLSRWLGFIQACLAFHGLTTVKEEREATRPLFREAYKEMGIYIPETQERNSNV
jgi:hypothetical protein